MHIYENILLGPRYCRDFFYHNLRSSTEKSISNRTLVYTLRIIFLSDFVL